MEQGLIWDIHHGSNLFNAKEDWKSSFVFLSKSSII